MFQKIKKIISINKTILHGISVFFIIAIFYCSSASAQTITSSPSAISVGQNENFSFTLSIDAVSNFFGIGFQLNYDAALLSYGSAAEGGLLSQGCSTSFLTAEDPTGTINVGLTRLGSDCGAVSGPGAIATFNFQSLSQTGSSNISFSDTALSIVDNGDLILPFPAGTWNTIGVTVSAASSASCGDGTCNGSETCSSCSTDCGICVTSPSPGGGSESPDPPPADSTPPAQPIGYGASAADKQITLIWTNPVDSDFQGVLIVRKEGIEPASKNDGTVVYQGSAQKYTDTNLDNNIIYYYGIFAYDTADNYSQVSAVSARPAAGVEPSEPETEAPSETITAKDCPENLTHLFGATKEVVACISEREAQLIYSRDEFTPLDDITLPIYTKIVKDEEAELTIKTKYSIASFIHYGTQATKILGAGERAGVVNSYRSVFNKFPHTESDWQDVIKIANGRWPDARNEETEEKTKNEIFKKIYLRAADMLNPNDNAAVTVITYGLRPANRNMESEKAGIKIFKAIYNYNPESATDWDIVRAIAYSGATR